MMQTNKLVAISLINTSKTQRDCGQKQENEGEGAERERERERSKEGKTGRTTKNKEYLTSELRVMTH